MRRTFALGLALAALSASPAASESSAQAVAELNGELLANPSATAVLQRWCAARRLADPAVIVAHRAPGPNIPPSLKVRTLLRAAPGEPIGYRRVALACGTHVLSNADNWYRPARLTAQMNVELNHTDHPFGAVVKPLDFHRQRLEARVLLAPGAKRTPAVVILQRALLETPDGTPFSLVVERYTAAVLDRGATQQPKGAALFGARR